MITFIVHANISDGLEDQLEEAMQTITNVASTNEPDFAIYTHFASDRHSVTFINLASDSAALGAHFAAAGDNPATAPMMEALEVTAVEIYGELTPDVEAMVAGMNPARFVPDIGTFDRRLASA
jgi:hypothetical protein